MLAQRFTLTAAKWISIAAGLAAAIYLLGLFYVYLASEAVIERRYTLPSSLIQATTDADAVSRGRRWMIVTGCFGCHGDDLKGRLLTANPDLPIWSSNLRLLAPGYTDGDFERAIRHGLTPDARPMWGMPSGSYTYMRDKDVEDIIAYIRAQRVEGVQVPKPRFDWPARRAILAGGLVPTSPKADEILNPADEGPRYDGGRYLSSVSCAQCHGGDLAGSGYAPDLNIAAGYTRTQFFQLLYEGRSRRGKWLPTMSPLARARFHYFHDYEVNALYDYLVARKTLTPWTKEQRANFNDPARKPGQGDRKPPPN